MKRKDIILALLVVIIWGANFTVIKLGLSGVPSMLLVTLRYVFTIIPAIFFIKKPKTEWKYIISYGFTVGFGQFACLYYAMEIGMPASLASIILQLQAFISPVLARLFLEEYLKAKQILSFLIAAIGLFFIATATGIDGITSVPIVPLIFTIFAAVFWSISNIIARYASQKSMARGEKLDMLGLVVWSSMVPPIPLLILAFQLDKPQTLISAITNLNGLSIFAILYFALLSTLFGYGMWGKLLAEYPIGKIAPLSLLVPVTGFLTARIVLSEKFSHTQLIGVMIILIGLAVSSIDLKQISSYFRKNYNQE